ncbi:SWIM zinc finger family protein (plasmid) [Diaphorobacter sp. HDW4B]|uniref:SWIM zinc finger family protein n=1 Tax=Diaphorobacter sp. HDW4B TaxID=2714925 RepID=UPI00140E0A9C|nr:SWIM zinc finger family protein [Diaphorobacter sp. HDW4B]QIL74211.1 SWIM zinc finger family protein [Diaphorobacter sp. HDW4B]
MTDQLAYSYLAPSHITQSADKADLRLATSGGNAPSGAVAHPFFFSGFVEQPAVVAQGLLMLARVARTRFFVPPNSLAAILRAADPVVTSTREGLRFESFSVCCGVYARLDVDASALDAIHWAPGVTNVDVNPPLRQALAALRGSEPLHLNVGDDELRVTTSAGEVVEDKVPLPKRWLKGFAETQMLSAGMTLRHELNGAEARQFISALPRASATKTVMWALRAVRSLRLGSSPAPGAVCVAGPERLRVLEPLLRFATGLRAYGPEVATGSLPLPSAWVLELPGARLTLGLSPEKARGFSGEGSVLHLLAGGDASEDAEFVSTLLAFEPRIDMAQLAERALLPQAQIASALSVLASFGQVGFDLAAGAYFHRPLPVQEGLLDTLHPRLADAQKLVSSGCVHAEGGAQFSVESSEQRYRVVLGGDPAEDRCTCPWYAKYRGTRGPCKHTLAVRIFTDPLHLNLGAAE